MHHVVWPTSRIGHHHGAQVHSGARVGGKPWSQLRSGLRGSLVLPADFDAARDDWRLGPPMAELLRLVNYVLFFSQIDDLADPTWCLFDGIFWRCGKVTEYCRMFQIKWLSCGVLHWQSGLRILSCSMYWYPPSSVTKNHRYILAISSSLCGSKQQRTGSIQRRSPKSGVPWNHPFSIGFSWIFH